MFLLLFIFINSKYNRTLIYRYDLWIQMVSWSQRSSLDSYICCQCSFCCNENSSQLKSRNDKAFIMIWSPWEHPDPFSFRNELLFFMQFRFQSRCLTASGTTSRCSEEFVRALELSLMEWAGSRSVFRKAIRFNRGPGCANGFLSYDVKNNCPRLLVAARMGREMPGYNAQAKHFCWQRRRFKIWNY